MTGPIASGEDGFSLIEALIALAILAVAAVGLIRAAESHVDTIGRLEERAAAGWVADNRLAELQLGPAAGSDGEVAMLGRRWQVAATIAGTGDPDLRSAAITVRSAGATVPLVTLDGFVDAHTVTLR